MLVAAFTGELCEVAAISSYWNCLRISSKEAQEAQLSLTVRITIRLVIAVDQLILTINLNMTRVNFISPIEMSIRGTQHAVMLCQVTKTLNYFKSRIPISIPL